MRILSAEQIYRADQATIKRQDISGTQLMERAGQRVFEWIHHELNGSQVPIHIFCGIGNNGGDGLVVGRLLREEGYNVRVYVVNFSKNRSADFRTNYERLKTVSQADPITINGEGDFPEIERSHFVVDAIFGIGLSRSPQGWTKKLIGHINASGAFVLSVDIPSGLYADKAIADRDAIVTADFTLTFQIPKLSFFLPDSAPYVSGFKILNIGLDEDFLDAATPLAFLIDKDTAGYLYRFREKFSHKGTYGHVLIVAGSYGKIGAAVLASSAAFKIGAGMVTAFVPKCGYTILQTTLPEAMVVTDEDEKLLTNIAVEFKPAAIAVGMGIGTAPKTVDALAQLLKATQKPMVLDADALNILSENRELLELVPKDSILTPHPGELKRLIGDWLNDFGKISQVKEMSKKYEVIVVIKGAYTCIVKGDNMYLNTSGNPGMATAGSGDTLSGILAGLLSQGYKPLEAVIFGVFMHGYAGDLAADRLGYDSLLAGDIISHLTTAYRNLNSEEEKGEVDGMSGL